MIKWKCLNLMDSAVPEVLGGAQGGGGLQRGLQEVAFIDTGVH